MTDLVFVLRLNIRFDGNDLLLYFTVTKYCLYIVIIFIAILLTTSKRYFIIGMLFTHILYNILRTYPFYYYNNYVMLYMEKKNRKYILYKLAVLCGAQVLQNIVVEKDA